LTAGSALIGDRAIEHDMAVERTANVVRDRVVVVVAVHQHREDASDGAAALEPRPADRSD
jgi:hypothetical protein